MKKTELNLIDTVFSQKSATPDTNEPLNQVNSIFNASVLPLSKTENKIKLAKNRIERLIPTKLTNKDDRFAKDKKLKSVKLSSKRKSAISIGISLLLMVVLAGVSIPILGTLTASIGLIGIFILDLIVSRSIFKYHKDENHKLSKTTGILRLVYTIILGIAVGFHIGGNVSMYNYIWGLGLIVFGAHLITLGILFKNPKGKRWFTVLIKGLLILAGVGYMLQYIGILLVANPVAFAAFVEPIFIIPMILGEVLYAIWMLTKGGK